jgi:hypothetical protein
MSLIRVAYRTEVERMLNVEERLREPSLGIGECKEAELLAVVVALARDAAFQQCDRLLERSLWSHKLDKDMRSTDWKPILDQHLTWDNNRLHSLVPPKTPLSFHGQAWLAVRAPSLQASLHQLPRDFLFFYQSRRRFIIGNHEIHRHSKVGGCLLS